MKCKNCNINEAVKYSKYSNGKFCSKECARAFSTKEKRQEINKKVSLKLGGGLTKQQRIQREIAEKHSYYVRKVEATSLADISKRTVVKILKRMKLPCSYDGWYVPDAVGDIHHIIPKKEGGSDDHNNLSYICPNCHRLVHSGIIKREDLVPLNEYIGDSWKDYYFVKYAKVV